MFKIYWDINSLLLYLFEAFVGLLCFWQACRANNGRTVKIKYNQTYLFLSVTYYIIWLFFAVFREVSDGRGGADAIDYVDFFRGCWGSMDEHMEHTGSDVLFLYFNRVIRYLTSNYHVFFFIAYGFISYSFLKFIKKFGNSFINVVPLFLIFYLYLRGYNTLRSHLCISIIMLGIIALLDGKDKKAYLLMICAPLIHKMGILYALVIPFVHYSLKKGIKFKYLILIVAFASVIGVFIRDYFILFASFYDLGGAYGSYANEAKEANNLLAGATECIFQYFLMVVLILFNKTIKTNLDQLPQHIRKSMEIVKYVCYFDCALIPLNVLFGIWRGLEFFYIPRLMMWGFVIFCFAKKINIKSTFFINSIVFIVVVAWMVFRIARIYEGAALMPYSLNMF